MKVILYITIGLAIIAASCDNSSKQKHGSAVFKSEKDTINFGDISALAESEQEIKIMNDGSDTLYISKVVASCGCTVAALNDTLIESGKSTTLHVRYKPDPKDTGFFSKSIVLRTNCEDPFKLIRIIGNVRP